MRILQSDIDNLVKYCGNLSKGSPEIQCYDIVSDCLLKLLESGQDFSIETAKKDIGKLFLTEKHLAPKQKGYRNFGSDEVDRHCKRCNEVFPIAMFYIIKSKGDNIQIIDTCCKKCRNKSNYIREKSIREKNESARLSYNERMKKWRDKNKKKWRDMFNKSQRQRRADEKIKKLNQTPL